MQTEKVAVTYRDALLGDQLQTSAHPEKELLGDKNQLPYWIPGS